MTKRLIKVCGIKDPDIAAMAVGLGVDMIGLMLDGRSRRLIDLDTAKHVSAMVLAAGGVPVVLSGSRNASEITTLCQLLRTDWVQLVGSIAHQAGADLSTQIRRLYTVSVKDKHAMQQLIKALPGYDEKRDYILFDAANPGHGEMFDHADFESPDVPFFIAGGLHPGNIKTVVKTIQPDGVDVSSGVERSLGEKDIDLIRLFVERARE